MIIYDSNGNRNRIATGVIHLLLTLLVILFLFTLHKCNNYRISNNEVNEMYNAASDSLQITRNQYREEVAKSTVLTANNNELFLSIQFKDKEIQHLQQIVRNAEKRNIELTSALYISNQTNIKLQDSIKNLITGWDTSITGDTLYPIYQRTFNIDSCFTSGTVNLGYTTFDLNLQIDNSYDVILGSEKVGLFKRKTFAEITTKNKCTTTKTLKVYSKEQEKKNILLPVGVGFGLGILLMLLL